MNNNNGCTKCGDVILADTEDFGPMCYECYDKSEDQVQIRELEEHIEELLNRIDLLENEVIDLETDLQELLREMD